MQKIIKKNEKGITLILLAITVVVLSLISIPIIMNFTNIQKVNDYELFKEDMDSLNEGVQLAYHDNTSISDIGPLYINSINSIASTKNANDNGNYYVISLDSLNQKLFDSTKIKLNYGEINKNYTTNSQYNNSNKTFGTSGYESADDVYIINEKTRTIYYIEGITYNEKTYYRLTDSYSTITSKTANIPSIKEGMIPIKYNGTNWTICSEDDTDWYNYTSAASGSTSDYNSSKWANAMSSDGRYKLSEGTIKDSGNSNATVEVGQVIAENDLGSMFVWIPRFAYKITSGLGTQTAGTIQIKFLRGTTDVSYDGETTTRTYSTSGTSMTNFVVHPAFRDGTSDHFANGEWDSEITGFWVAKFPAGYQASTINSSGTLQNGTSTVIRSNINYSGIDNGYTSNPVDSNITTSTKISYPVFKPLTYAYNCIRIGDSYSISRNIKDATNFYGLSNVDSHLEKNSEWGAVAYLTQSSYGRNGTEVNINNYNMNNSNSKNTYCVTGLYGSGTSDAATTSISSANAYNTSTGVKGSSTGNVYGVYDLNGCLWERTAGYITNGNANLSNYGNSFAYTTADATPQTNNRSTKWATAYPYDSTNDIYTSNWTKYKTSNYGFGDAILEISNGSTSWNEDTAYFPDTIGPFFERAGSYNRVSSGGIFYFTSAIGSSLSGSGFRVILIGE